MEELRTVQIYPDQLTDGSCLLISAASVQGTRKYQQDSLFYHQFENGLLGVICDGMGGMEYGDRASITAIDTIASFFQMHQTSMKLQREDWKRMIDQADHKVAELSRTCGSSIGSGSTMVAALIQDHHLTIASVGDSMIYLVRNGMCMPLVRQHNFQMIMDAEDLPEDSRVSAEALVSYLGMDGVEIWDYNSDIVLEDHDVLLLCSDGLYKALSEDVIAAVISSVNREYFDDMSPRLIRQIFNGEPRSLDNISILCFGVFEHI